MARFLKQKHTVSICIISNSHICKITLEWCPSMAHTSTFTTSRASSRVVQKQPQATPLDASIREPYQWSKWWGTGSENFLVAPMMMPKALIGANMVPCGSVEAQSGMDHHGWRWPKGWNQYSENILSVASLWYKSTDQLLFKHVYTLCFSRGFLWAPQGTSVAASHGIQDIIGYLDPWFIELDDGKIYRKVL